jgi:excisionase family DNA binding protein
MQTTSKIQEPDSVSVGEACKIIGVGRTLLYRLMDDGDLRYAKLGSRCVIPRCELSRLLTDNLVETESRSEK